MKKEKEIRLMLIKNHRAATEAANEEIKALQKIEKFTEQQDTDIEPNHNDTDHTKNISYLQLSIQKDPEQLKKILAKLIDSYKEQQIKLMYEQRDQSILKNKIHTIFKNNVSFLSYAGT